MTEDSAVPTRFIPLAITRVDQTFACVGAITDEGRWVRPEPVLLREVEDPAGPYHYHVWVRAVLGRSIASEPRPEDCAVLPDQTPQVETIMHAGERQEFMCRHTDSDVDSVFCNGRSLGLIEARVLHLYSRKSTRGRHFICSKFQDRSGKIYDWVVPELRFCTHFGHQVERQEMMVPFPTGILRIFEQVQCFLSVGLTRPNHRFPGAFGGCQPLVVGVHTFPDYMQLLTELS